MPGSQFRSLVQAIRLSAAAALLIPLPSFAQKQVSAPRADGQMTPLLVYSAAGVETGCAPLAVISHGAGGSENGYRYLATALSQNGYTAIVMGHRQSGLQALRRDIREYGLIAGVRALVADPEAEQARLLDVGAALKWAEGQCAAPFRVLLGHSMGAETVMLEAGARNIIGVSSPPAGQDRVDAYVALSPEGPGIVFPEDAWKGIRKPVLILTGTHDQSLQGGPQARQVPWHDLPGEGARKCQWMGVIKGARHMNFAGNGLGANHVEPLVTQTIRSFLAGVRARGCTLPAPKIGMTLQAK
jgi:predicted dienelactone hydrolase